MNLNLPLATNSKIHKIYDPRKLPHNTVILYMFMNLFILVMFCDMDKIIVYD